MTKEQKLIFARAAMQATYEAWCVTARHCDGERAGGERDLCNAAMEEMVLARRRYLELLSSE